MNKLDEIIAHKRTEVEKLLPRVEKLRAAATLRNDFRSLADALRNDPARLGIIAEIKRASPSAGTIAQVPLSFTIVGIHLEHMPEIDNCLVEISQVKRSIA